MKNRSMSYSFTLHNSIDDVCLEDWRQLCHQESDPFMDPRFIRAVERTMSDSATFWHVVFRDDQQNPVASACLYSYLLDMSFVCSGWTKKAMRLLQWVAPFLTQLKLMICGLPVPTGQSHLRIAPQADATAVLYLLDKILHELALREGAKCILFREFSDGECARLAPLHELGYSRGNTPPMNHTRANYRDFDAYCNGVKSRKRYTLKRSRKKFASSGLRVVHRNGHQGIDRIYTDEVHGLLEAVVEGKATFELLPAAFFRELAVQMPDEAAFTFIEDEDRVVAFAASLCTHSAYHQLMVGFDYELNPTCDLYFNLFFNVLDDALKRNVSDIILGQTSDTFKIQKLSAYQQSLYIYAKALHWLVSLFLSQLKNVDSQCQSHSRTDSPLLEQTVGA